MPPINPTASTEFVPKSIAGKDSKEVAEAMGKMMMGKHLARQGGRDGGREGWEGRVENERMPRAGCSNLCMNGGREGGREGGGDICSALLLDDDKA